MDKRFVVRSVSLLWVGSLIGAGLAFLAQIILARGLPVAEFGVLSATLSILNIVSPLAGFGIQSYWLKVFAEEGVSAVRWFRGSFYFAGMSSLVLVLVLVGWAVLGPNDDSTERMILILASCVFGQAVLELVSARLQLEGRYFFLAIWSVLPHFVRFVMVAILVAYFGDYATAEVVAMIFVGISALLLVGGGVVLYRMRGGDLSLCGYKGVGRGFDVASVAFPTMIDVAKRSWPFALSTLFYLLGFQVAVVILKYLQGDEAAAVYSVALVVMAAVYLFPGVVYQKFMMPKLHVWAANDGRRFSRAYSYGGRLMLFFGLGAMVMVLIFAGTVPWLFGDEYAGSVPLLMILSVAAPIRFVSSSVASVITAGGFEKGKVLVMGCGAFFALLLSFVLVWGFGGVGAALSVVFSELFLLLAFYVFFRCFVVPVTDGLR